MQASLFHNCAVVTRRLTVLLVLFLLSLPALATHNRAGEITYKRIGTNRIEVKIVTYTKSSAVADRPALELWWGDGDRDTLPRSNIDFNVGPDIQRNTYYGTHTYPGTGSYTIYFLDENRNAGVKNIPGSVNIPFYVETKFVISPVITSNSSPVLLQPPIDNGVVGQIFVHNPNAYDPDGDSLTYELVDCKGANGQPIPGYVLPAATNSFTLDTVTGDLIWDSPLVIGEYNVAMIIREWRTIPGYGTLNIGSVTRDMQITILAPTNLPPVIAAINDTCVLAGDSLDIVVNATEPENQLITLTALGGPFNVTNSPATFTSTPQSTTNTGVFHWVTSCEHVRNNPYSVVVKAEDNDPDAPLVDLEQFFITVVGPAPENPTITPFGNGFNLTWNKSKCAQAIGYKIYRHAGSTGWTHSQCETGVPAYTGYQYVTTVNGLNDTTYSDTNNGGGLVYGIDYCYLIVAIYPDGAESYASVEFCAMLRRDMPILTNVDVLSTDVNTGTIYVAWSKPTDLDFTQTPGPFRYILQRGVAGSGFADIAVNTDLNDTLFTDGGLNTVNNQYVYRIEFWNDTPGNTFKIGTTPVATSIFLTVAPGDEKNRLSWAVNVPWPNQQYVIYRKDPAGVTFDSLDVASTLNYVDKNLVNGLSYCYYIQSIGAYTDSSLVHPILNKSQQVCSVPLDNEPPCAATLQHIPNCEAITDSLYWSIPDSCGFDVATFNVYYAPVSTQQYELLYTAHVSEGSYLYQGISSVAGCYYLTATDSAGNTGAPSDTVCVETCPVYTLPNVFTPNEDGFNDTYIPFPYRDVKDVDMTIYNRWGAVMFGDERSGH